VATLAHLLVPSVPLRSVCPEAPLPVHNPAVVSEKQTITSMLYMQYVHEFHLIMRANSEQFYIIKSHIVIVPFEIGPKFSSIYPTALKPRGKP